MRNIHILLFAHTCAAVASSTAWTVRQRYLIAEATLLTSYLTVARCYAFHTVGFRGPGYVIVNAILRMRVVIVSMLSALWANGTLLPRPPYCQGYLTDARSYAYNVVGCMG